MGEKSRDARPVIKGDKFILDFGKTILRPKPQDADAGERKLPPEPGRAAPEDFVPEDEVLNRGSKRDE
jgi:hypothetical protein